MKPKIEGSEEHPMRPDGTRVKDIPPIVAAIPYIMPKRYDAQNTITEYIYEELVKSYIREKRRGGVRINHMALLIAAYYRAVLYNPKLNYFVMNGRIYQRNHFCVSFVTLTNSGEGSTVNKVYFNLDDDIYTVNDKLSRAIEKSQETGRETPMDVLAKKIVRIPGLVSIAVSFLKFIDKHFTLPFSIIDASPFHTSLFVTNLASIRTGAVYHHIYEFGTTGIFASMGQPVKKLFKNGETIEEHKVMELGIVTDERIADGHYYGRCFKELKKFYRNPELLETKPETVIRDKDIKHKNPKFICR